MNIQVLYENDDSSNWFCYILLKLQFFVLNSKCLAKISCNTRNEMACQKSLVGVIEHFSLVSHYYPSLYLHPKIKCCDTFLVFNLFWKWIVFCSYHCKRVYFILNVQYMFFFYTCQFFFDFKIPNLKINKYLNQLFIYNNGGGIMTRFLYSNKT